MPAVPATPPNAEGAVVRAVGAFQLDARADEVVAELATAGRSRCSTTHSVLERADCRTAGVIVLLNELLKIQFRATFEADVNAARLERLRLRSERCRSKQRCTNDHPLHLVSPRLCCL